MIWFSRLMAFGRFTSVDVNLIATAGDIAQIKSGVRNEIAGRGAFAEAPRSTSAVSRQPSGNSANAATASNVTGMARGAHEPNHHFAYDLLAGVRRLRFQATVRPSILLCENIAGRLGITLALLKRLA
jgi:hypothetical protein